jgi:hypothetical protein
MKTKKLNKTLSLNKVTVSNLDNIKGGLPLWTYATCPGGYTDPDDGCSQCSMCNTLPEYCEPDTAMCSNGACASGDWTLCTCDNTCN